MFHALSKHGPNKQLSVICSQLGKQWSAYQNDRSMSNTKTTIAFICKTFAKIFMRVKGIF